MLFGAMSMDASFYNALREQTRLLKRKYREIFVSTGLRLFVIWRCRLDWVDFKVVGLRLKY